MPKKPPPLLALYGLLIGFLLAATAFVPFTCIAIPFILAAAGMANGQAVSVGAALFGAALVAMLFGVESAIALLLFAPAGIVLPVVVKRKWSSFGSVALAAILTCAALLMMAQYFYPNGINALLNVYRNEIFDQLSTMSLAGLINAAQADMMKSIYTQGFEAVEIALPGITIAYSMLSSLIAYLVCRKSAKKRAIEITPLPEFAKWRLPKGFGLGAVILILGIWVLPSFYESAALSYALQTTVSLPLSVLGICVLDFFLTRAKVPKGWRVALIIVAVTFASYVLLFIGVFDQAFKLRQRVDTTSV